MKKQYTKKQITEAISYWEKKLRMINESTTNFSSEPTALEVIQAILQDKDLSQNLALQLRVWARIDFSRDDFQFSQVKLDKTTLAPVPRVFPIVDVKSLGRNDLKLVCYGSEYANNALTLMELKTKFLDAKVNQNDKLRGQLVIDNVVDIGQITGVQVMTGKSRFGQHMVLIDFSGGRADEMTRLLDRLQMQRKKD